MALLLNQFVMLDRGGCIKKMVEQFPPFLVPRRTAKAHRMILFRLPVYQQHVPALCIDRPLQLVREVALRRRKDSCRFGKYRFKRQTIARAYSQRRDFKNHVKDFTHR